MQIIHFGWELRCRIYGVWGSATSVRRLSELKKMTMCTGKYFPMAIKEVHEVELPLRERNEALERGRKAKDEEPLEEEEEMELEEEEEEERRRRRRIVEDEFEDVSWETLDEDARANLYYYVVDNFLTAEHFSCYPLEEDEIQPPQSPHSSSPLMQEEEEEE